MVKITLSGISNITSYYIYINFSISIVNKSSEGKYIVQHQISPLISWCQVASSFTMTCVRKFVKMQSNIFTFNTFISSRG